ncbi:MAG: hypothetical protein ACPLXL_00025 [Minisyncoccia bacterium]
MERQNNDLSIREKDLLKEIIELYCQQEIPISSLYLAKRLNYRFSPATIRNDFLSLTNKGYLKKIHSFSGRIPTNQGLRFYINYILREKLLEKTEKEFSQRIEKILFNFLKIKNQTNQLEEKIPEIIAQRCQSYSFFYSLKDGEIIAHGFRFLVREIENLETDHLLELGKFLDNLEDILRNLRLEEEMNFFIGKENPYLKLEPLAMVVTLNKRKNKMLGLLGHKKILYFKNLAILKAGKKFID